MHAYLGFKDMEYTCTKIERGLQFTYRNVGDCLAEVVCRVTADEGDGGMLRWRISATPKPGWATYEICYPSLALTESLGIKPAPTLVVAADGAVEKYVGVADIKKYIQSVN